MKTVFHVSLSSEYGGDSSAKSDTVIVGKNGSGKSSFVRSVMTCKTLFSTAFYFPAHTGGFGNTIVAGTIPLPPIQVDEGYFAASSLCQALGALSSSELQSVASFWADVFPHKAVSFDSGGYDESRGHV